MSDYTNYPTTTDVDNALAAFGITPRSTATKADHLAAIIAEVKRATRREFTTTTESRYFDGDGTGELIVDDYIPGSVTSITLYSYPQLGSGTLVTSWCERYSPQAPSNIIEIRRGSQPALNDMVYLGVWPAGRQNLQVAATWGYGRPWTDLWDAIRDQAAALVAAESQYVTGGRTKDWKDAEVSEGLDLTLPGELTNARKRLDAAIARHRVSNQLVSRRFTRRMV